MYCSCSTDRDLCSIFSRSSTYSAVSADFHSDLNEPGASRQLPSAKSTSSAEKSSINIGPTSPSMTMCVASPPQGSVQMASILTSSPEVSPARTSASPEKEPDCPVSEAASGSSSAVSSRKSARRGSSSKTLAPFDLADWMRCSGASLRSGTTRSGIVFPLPPLVRLTGEIASGLWPTPQVSPNQNRDTKPKPSAINGTHGWTLAGAVHDSLTARPIKTWPTPTSRDYKDGSARSCRNVPVNGLLGRAVHQSDAPPTTGSLNPTWVEWLMGFPIGWTDCGRSATRSSRKSRK